MTAKEKAFINKVLYELEKEGFTYDEAINVVLEIKNSVQASCHRCTAVKRFEITPLPSSR